METAVGPVTLTPQYIDEQLTACRGRIITAIDDARSALYVVEATITTGNGAGPTVLTAAQRLTVVVSTINAQLALIEEWRHLEMQSMITSDDTPDGASQQSSR